ncbi:alpha/beta-Hydrolases superfamily protein [Tasmannia lanceolata]|uniref:alpha/beta-Hydrolases superfamily protein n=1 Tax=Tasmannia lanceolata TaxID=3420 RepID=UPI0040637486
MISATHSQLNVLVIVLTCSGSFSHVRPLPFKISTYKYQFRIRGKSESLQREEMEALNITKLRSDFINVLLSRRSGEAPLSVESATPVTNPMYQGGPASREAMESCPKKNVSGLNDRLKEENLYLITEAGEQGRLPVLILSLTESKQLRRPAIVFLHSSYRTKEWVRPLLEAYASRGYVAVAIDSRYHGERATNTNTYREALVSSWRNGKTMPFIFDTVWDLIKLADYLTQRDDIDPCRIGITGESLGGMHAWFAAFADVRYAVVVPIIGVQGFRWAIDNDQWQARVDSIKPVFEDARIDLGKSSIDKEVVEKVWDRIAPGLACQFDSPYTVPAIAPRPLLILNGAEDPRCPLAGLKVPELRAIEAYREANCPDNFKLIAEPGIGHQMTSFMVKEASNWFDMFLKRDYE